MTAKERACALVAVYNASVQLECAIECEIQAAVDEALERAAEIADKILCCKFPTGRMVAGAIRELKSQPKSQPPMVKHGVDCPKVEHDPAYRWLHAGDDDGPVGPVGTQWCGRCHEADLAPEGVC